MLRQHRDLEAEIRTVVAGPVKIIVFDLVLLELQRLARTGAAGVRAWANAAIDFLGKRNYPTVEHVAGPTDVDVSLVQFTLAERIPTAIATIDGELREALASFGVPAISPKARHGLIASSFRL